MCGTKVVRGARDRAVESILSTAVLRFNTMQRPSVRQLDDALASAARGIASRIADDGGRAWIVGGAVRDLALRALAEDASDLARTDRSGTLPPGTDSSGTVPEPVDVDLATDLVPDRIEAVFEKTLGVGKAFGTMLVIWGDVTVEVTTFRSERGYSDARRPDEVTYGTSVEEDAARRDFTCNALYLDPLTDEFRDPERGLEDLAAGRLRCVGEAAERFREDGLRILRLARFAARLGLAPDAASRAAATDRLDALRGVSAERVCAEFEKVLGGPRPATAFRLLVEFGAHERVAPGWWSGDAGSARIDALERLGSACGATRGLAVLYDPAPLSAAGAPSGSGDHAAALEALDGLRVSRALRREVDALWDLQSAIDALTRDALGLAARRRALRDPAFADAAAVFAARCPDRADAARALADEARAADPAWLRPAPLLDAAQLIEAGVPRGPRLGELLRALEDEQLGDRVRDEHDARAWLADQLGGNQRRNDHDTG